MSLRPRATPPVVSPVASRLDFVLRVGTNERSVEDVGVLERKGGPRSDFDKFTDTNEARLYRQRVARARAANAAKHKAAMEAAAAADAQAKEVLGSDEPQWLQDAAAAVKAAPARPTRAEAGVQTAPEQEARERIERNETELLTSVGLQVNLRDDGAAILREVKEQIKADGAQLEKMHGTIDSLRLQRDRMVAVLEDLVAQGVKDREKIALVEATIASTQTTIDTLAKNFDRFMEESAAIIKDSIRDLLENRLQALENNCINEVAKQTNEIKKLREQISRMADKDVVGDIMERVAERRAHEADEMRKLLSLINPERFAKELTLAIESNNLEKVKILVDFGADPYRIDGDSNYDFAPLEWLFYGGNPRADPTLDDSKIDDRIAILNFLGAKGFTLHELYHTNGNISSFYKRPTAAFWFQSGSGASRWKPKIPSKLLVGALKAGVLSNKPELFKESTFTVGETTRNGTTPLYDFGLSLFSAFQNAMLPKRRDMSINAFSGSDSTRERGLTNYKNDSLRMFENIQKTKEAATQYFKELLRGGFRDDGLRSQLEFIAKGKFEWKKLPLYPEPGTVSFEAASVGATENKSALHRYQVRKDFGPGCAREVLALMDTVEAQSRARQRQR